MQTEQNGNRALWSQEVEGAVISCCVNDPRALEDAADLVKAEQFFAPVNAQSWNILVELWAKRAPVDLMTFTEAWNQSGELEKIEGGAGFLASEYTKVGCGQGALLYWAEQLRDYGCHYGMDLDEYGLDRGLNAIFPAPGVYAGGIARFVSQVGWECGSFPDGTGIVTIWHPHATAEVADRLLSECRASIVAAETLDEAKAGIEQALGRDLAPRKVKLLPPVLLLRVPRAVMEQLRAAALVHTGFWRDESTGIDRGLADAMSAGGQLRTWFAILDREAEWRNQVVGIWHPDATEDHAATTGRRVAVINGQSLDEALKQVAEATA
jgi:hypothetical protein